MPHLQKNILGAHEGGMNSDDKTFMTRLKQISSNSSDFYQLYFFKANPT